MPLVEKNNSIENYRIDSVILHNFTILCNSTIICNVTFVIYVKE